MIEESKQVSCPNCLGPAIKEGNKIICEACDATFTITRTGGAKVKEIGKLNDHEGRIIRLESLLLGQEPAPEPKKPDEPEESSILGD